MITRRIQIKAMSSRLFSNQDLAVLFFPLVIEQTLKYSLGLADSMMIASVGEAAISGVSLMDFVLSFITSLFAALLVGGSAVISQYIGARETEQANKAANQLVLIVGIFSLFLCVAVYAAKYSGKWIRSDLWVSDKKNRFSMLGKREKSWLSVIISQNIFRNRGTFARKTGTH